MECRDVQLMLSAFHDGELSPEERGEVEVHLASCRECTDLLEAVARLDEGVSVPDPGVEYWDSFNRRLAERIGSPAEGRHSPAGEVPPQATPRAGEVPPPMPPRQAEKEREKGSEAGSGKVVLLPARGWGRGQLRYILPAAAAALLVVVVRYGGLAPDPREELQRSTEEFSRSAPLAVETVTRGVAASDVNGARAPLPPGTAAPQSLPAAQIPAPLKAKAKSTAVAPAEDSAQRPAYATESVRPGFEEARSFETKKESARDTVSKGIDLVPPSPAALQAGEEYPAARRPTASPAPALQSRSGGYAASISTRAGQESRERGFREGAVGESARGFSASSRQDAPSSEFKAKSNRLESSAADAARVSPSEACDRARLLVDRGDLVAAEAAQRECLARDPSPATQERGLVLLAEILDRQGRTREANGILSDAGRLFPASGPLARYLDRRVRVQEGVPASPADR